MITALVPAAGRSTRMGRPKAWLPYGGTTFLEHVIATALEAETDAVVVVAGCEEPTEAGLVSRLDVAVRTAHLRSARVSRISVAIGCPEGTQIDSVRKGLELVADDSAVLLWPVDCPFADADLLVRMVQALGDAPSRIIVPQVGDRHGHPVLFGSAVAAELATPLADSGAHAVLKAVPERVVTIACADPRLCQSVNTPDDLARAGNKRKSEPGRS